MYTHRYREDPHGSGCPEQHFVEARLAPLLLPVKEARAPFGRYQTIVVTEAVGAAETIWFFTFTAAMTPVRAAQGWS